MREKILRGGAALIIRQAVSLPINAIGVVFASRFLLPRDFGIQAVLTPIIALSFMAIDLGTSQALVQRKQDYVSSLLRKIQLLKSISAVFLIAAFGLLSSRLVQIINLPMNLLLIFPACGLMGWLQSQRALFAVSLQRRIEWQKLAKVEMVEIIVYNVILVASAFYLRSAWCFVIALGCRMAVGMIILMAIGGSPVNKEDVNAEAVGPLLRYGIPLQSATLLSVMMNSANPIVVGGFLGMRAVGFVNWGNYIVSLPQLPLQPLPNFLFSVLSERGRREKNDRAIIEDISYFGGFIMAAFSLVIIASLDALVRYVFGLQWVEAIPAVSILVLTNLFVVPSLVLTAQLNANGYPTSSLLIAGLGVFLIWTLILISALLDGGLVGYALGILGATVITFVVQCLVASRRLNIRVSWKKNLIFLCYVSVCIFSAEMVIRFLKSPDPILSGLMKIAISAGLFFIFVIAFEGRRLKQLLGTLRLIVYG